MELAKVHEYEVMWTSQLTQKIKKWNDGTLKFHTFNKRAMLYDSSGIFVADLFLKKPVEEGDELKFGHFLVTVDARLRTVEKDISAIYTRKTDKDKVDKTQRGITPSNNLKKIAHDLLPLSLCSTKGRRVGLARLKSSLHKTRNRNESSATSPTHTPSASNDEYGEISLSKSVGSRQRKLLSLT